MFGGGNKIKFEAELIDRVKHNPGFLPSIPASFGYVKQALGCRDWLSYAAEVLARMIGRGRPVRQSRSAALFLASLRIASSPMMALVLIAAAALPVATLVYAANLSRSSSSTRR